MFDILSNYIHLYSVMAQNKIVRHRSLPVIYHYHNGSKVDASKEWRNTLRQNPMQTIHKK
jgi:hypothetical protein